MVGKVGFFLVQNWIFLVFHHETVEVWYETTCPPILGLETSKDKASALVETVADLCKASKLGDFDHFRVSIWCALGASQPCRP